MTIEDLRKEYTRASLSETDAHSDPVTLFTKWFDDAVRSQLLEPNAMSVATTGSNGRPSSRIVLIKNFNRHGFTWFTNYGSRKGDDLKRNPYAALLFHWVELERQVRIEGRVERVSVAENERYFQSRPLKSKLGSIASAQSHPIASREALEAKFLAADEQYGNHPHPPRPENWGGYRLIPDYFEFWQGRHSRLHDRILYTLQQDGSWQRQRLQP